MPEPGQQRPSAAAAPRSAVEQAWELAYLDPARAGAIGRGIAELGGRDAGWGWLHVALAELREGDAAVGHKALARARAVFQDDGDGRGLTLADEVQAVALRRAGDAEAAAHLHRQIDQRPGLTLTAHDRFLAHNSRAITQQRLGRVDDALAHFYAAADAAADCGHAGARIVALSNLGACHRELFNLDEATALCAQALKCAREAGVRHAVAANAANLIMVHHAAGRQAQASAMAQFMLSHAEELPAQAEQRYGLHLALGHLAAGDLAAAQQRLDDAAGSAARSAEDRFLWAWVQARCALGQGDPARARAVAETALSDPLPTRRDQHYNQMQTHLAAADACEAQGDAVAALAQLRRAHALYQVLVARSARARYGALRASREVATAQRERDLAQASHRSAEDDRRRLTELNEALRAQVVQTELLHAKLQEQALRDPLTGLHNRRHLFETGPGLLELARRNERPLCVVLLDLDHFKLLNDTYGHHAGDTVLQHFATLLAGQFRRSDVVCRHGGEEFVAVLPDIDASGAQAMLQRLLETFESQTLAHGRRRLPRCTFSAGIAVFPAHGLTLEQLLSRADKALYAAKHLGRARIEQVPHTDFSTLS